GQSGFSNLRPVGLDILGAIVEGDGAGGLHGVLRLGALYGGSEGDVVELIDVGLFGGFDLIGGHDGDVDQLLGADDQVLGVGAHGHVALGLQPQAILVAGLGGGGHIGV